MDVETRIRTLQLIDNMNHQKDFCKKMGVKNKSHYIISSNYYKEREFYETV